MSTNRSTAATTVPREVIPAGSIAAATAKARLHVALLTGGDDPHYAHGLTDALLAAGVHVEFIGSDKLDSPRLHNNPQVRFLNLRGDQTESVGLPAKVRRILLYYLRLFKYAATARPRLFHILWNNKFEHFDRTVLMLWYRLCGRRVVMTAHNVNAAERDGYDSAFNRATLRVQYRLCDHIFVHTRKMMAQLTSDFGVPERKISVIPFGLNDTTPKTDLTGAEARQRLGLGADDRVLLFFGQIAPYKGLEYLLAALEGLAAEDPRLRLVVAGKVKKGFEAYWRSIAEMLAREGIRGRVLTRIEHIPDSDIETFFKAADVLVLPYTHIFQSGVPFLGFSFGLPVVATDVGELREDVIDGKTGFICPPRDPAALARAIRTCFASDLYRQGEESRRRIRAIALEGHSWATVAEITKRAYVGALAPNGSG